MMATFEFCLRCITTAFEAFCGLFLVLIAVIVLFKLFRNKSNARTGRVNRL